MTTQTTRFLTVLLALGLGHAAAQTDATRLTLQSAVSRALASGPDVTTARANLQKAQANLRAVRADPTSIITTLTQAEQDNAAAAVTLDGTKLNVAQTVISQYLAAYEAGGRISLNSAQVALDKRNLQIAQARLAARVATQLDVNRAATGLGSNTQALADAQAQLPVLKAQLARSLGLPTGTALTLADPPAPPRLSSSLATLQAGLEKRLPSLSQASNGLSFAALQVRLADNDYTPARTLEDARTAQANAQRSLDDAVKAGKTMCLSAEKKCLWTQSKGGKMLLNNSENMHFAFLKNKAKSLILKKLSWNNNPECVVVHDFSFMDSRRH